MNNINLKIHSSAKIYGSSTIGENSVVLENVILGYPEHKILSRIVEDDTRIEDSDFQGCEIGPNSFIRPNTTIFSNVRTGSNFKTGHNCMIRENTTIGNNVLIGTNVIIDGNVTIGNNVSIQGNAYIPTNVMIEDNVFIGPCAVLANDKYPIRKEYRPEGPIIRKGASIGANATILPGVEIGEGAFIAGGALVTREVPPWKLAIGCPAKIEELPEELRSLNSI
ncbi:N-acetyltransferase [Methanococcoides orientis]|uniref:acyltransferase n=1 Tax=Methanococcoides orientis TaxID=2822137 RepID=UPI001E2A026F|nr:acyltransferase [Methanococcoides orientis]UGV41028.1 N-acetyltransferase [Methanococcoides orientis]